jgi:hypothetical protein
VAIGGCCRIAVVLCSDLMVYNLLTSDSLVVMKNRDRGSELFTCYDGVSIDSTSGKLKRAMMDRKCLPSCSSLSSLTLEASNPLLPPLRSHFRMLMSCAESCQ